MTYRSRARFWTSGEGVVVTSFTTDAISSAGFCIMASAFRSTNTKSIQDRLGGLQMASMGTFCALGIRSKVVSQKSRS